MAIGKRRIGRRNETRMVMPKRLKELAAETTVSQLATKIRDSANQIWLAGLGAFSKAQQEGVEMFEGLVAEGEKVQERTKTAADERLGEVREKVNWTPLVGPRGVGFK